MDAFILMAARHWHVYDGRPNSGGALMTSQSGPLLLALIDMLAIYTAMRGEDGRGNGGKNA